MTAAPPNKRDSADDLETSESAESEAWESPMKHGPFGDMMLTTWGLVMKVTEDTEGFGGKLTRDPTEVTDMPTLELVWEADKLPPTSAEDAPMTMGWGMAAMGWADWGMAKAGDEAETAGPMEMWKMAAIGAETPWKSSD